ncbi:MAG: S-layer homology domain-containing protein [Nodosilinea sp.]
MSARRLSVMVAGLSLLLVTSCAGSSLEQSLEADPQLQDRPVFDEDLAETAEIIEPESTERSDVAASTPVSSTETTPPLDVSNPEALLDETPSDLRPYVQDWLTLEAAETDSETVIKSQFEPNQPITRGEFADWLLTANNTFYADAPAKRIRPSTSSTNPTFQDVPASYPYFAAIQGLAEAGLIPSAKTGNATAVSFRPDAPLTRENLVLWKAPLDSRATLPTATTEAVAAAWGFQDAAKIEPLALRAVLADYQNGDFANIRRAFGYTTLFQPQAGVTQAEAAAALWRFGSQTEGLSVEDLLKSSFSEPAPQPTRQPQTSR